MQRILLPLAIVLTLVAWASAFIGIRAVAPHFDPGSLALGRLLAGTVALGAVLVVRRGWVKPTRREWLLLAIFGVGWFGIYNVTLNAAAHFIDPGTSAMVVNIAPLIVALVAGGLLGEGFPRWLVIGAIIAFGGVSLIGVATSSGQLSLVGVLLALAATATYAIGVLVQKPLLRRLPSLQVTFLGVLIGTVCCLPWSGSLLDQLGQAPTSAIAGVIYLGLVPTAAAFLLWGYALTRMPAGRLTTLAFLVPAITTVGAWALLGEVPPPLALVGGVVCLVGVVLTRIPSRERVPVE